MKFWKIKEFVKKAFECNELPGLITGSGEYFLHDPYIWSPAPNDEHEIELIVPDIREYIRRDKTAWDIFEECMTTLPQRSANAAYVSFSLLCFWEHLESTHPEMPFSEKMKDAVIEGVRKYRPELEKEKLFANDPKSNATTKYDMIKHLCRIYDKENPLIQS